MQEDNEIKKNHQWVSDRTIAHRYEIARSTVWAWAKDGKLPKPVKLSANITRWDNAEVEKSMGG